MTVRLTDEDIIVLEGACPTEDAEALLRLLSSNRQRVVDWRGCEQAHTAVIQLLLAARPKMIGPPAGGFLRDHLDIELQAGAST